MLILVGRVDGIVSKKSGTEYSILHLLEENVLDTSKEKGQLTSTVFVESAALSDGSIQVEGDMVIGSYIRIMKEQINGMDKISYIVCKPRKK